MDEIVSVRVALGLVRAPVGVMAGQPTDVATPFPLIVDPADLHF